MTRLALGLALLVLAAGCGEHGQAFGDFERMRIQQRYDLWSKSGVFADGKAMQAPPAHTVALEEAPTPPAPDSITPALLHRGHREYAIYCAVCHGAAGYGGSIVATNMEPPRPPSLRVLGSDKPPSYLFGVITSGKGRMPSYAPQLAPSDRWAIVAYLQQLSTMPAVDADEIADSVRAAALNASPAGAQ